MHKKLKISERSFKQTFNPGNALLAGRHSLEDCNENAVRRRILGLCRVLVLTVRGVQNKSVATGDPAGATMKYQ